MCEASLGSAGPRSARPLSSRRLQNAALLRSSSFPSFEQSVQPRARLPQLVSSSRSERLTGETVAGPSQPARQCQMAADSRTAHWGARQHAARRAVVGDALCTQSSALSWGAIVSLGTRVRWTLECPDRQELGPRASWPARRRSAPGAKTDPEVPHHARPRHHRCPHARRM